MGVIDRRKHDIDVMERVLGGIQDEPVSQGPHTGVVDIDARPWVGGFTTSAVQMTIGIRERPERLFWSGDRRDSH
jgi:hypothetical protein